MRLALRQYVSFLHNSEFHLAAYRSEFADMKRSGVWVLEDIAILGAYVKIVLPIALMVLVSVMASTLSGVLLFLFLR